MEILANFVGAGQPACQLYIERQARPGKTEVGLLAIDQIPGTVFKMCCTQLPAGDDKGIAFETCRMVEKVQRKGYLFKM